MARPKILPIPDAALAKIPGVAQYRMAQAGAEIIIGGDHPSLVLPEVHSEKWGGECYLKIRHADADAMLPQDRATEAVNSKGGLVIELPVSAKGRRHQIQEGSLKWDVIYDSAAAVPVDGIERFALDFPTGLSFYFQPQLTAEEIAEGHQRPDNVIGSYAIYWNQAGRYLDALGAELVNYETGKYAHLYRPEMVDADGNRCWADQQIVGNELQVTLPLSWLETAVYPVTLDPTFGYTSVGGSPANQSAGRTQVIGGFTPGVAGTITDIDHYTARTATASDLSVGAYSGSSSPTDLVVSSSPITPSSTTPHWETFSGLSGAFGASDTLYVGSYSDGTSNSYYYDTSGSTWYYISANWPDPMTGESSVVRIQSTYATYTEGGGGSTYEGSLSLSAASALANTPAAVFNASITYAAAGDVSESGSADLQASLALAAQVAQSESAGATFLTTLALSGAAGLSTSVAAALAASITLPASASLLSSYGNIVSAALALEAVGLLSPSVQADLQGALDLIAQAGSDNTATAIYTDQILLNLQAQLAAAFEAGIIDASTSLACSAALSATTYAELAATLTFATGTTVTAAALQEAFASVSLQTIAAIAATYPGDLVTALKVLAIFRAKDPGASFTAKDPGATFN